ncbi:hypothetical protein [Limnohabitans sp.]|jgi:hypothetical protein|uniref:hypothetical protein n=1 Tax=Limnohabitans sp. TaxID=1907725 RepID=UPI00391C9809
MRTPFVLSALLGALMLVACGEKVQDQTGARSDKPARAGTGVAAFTEPGWKAGDEASWSNHLRARASYGMNDYQRAPK